MKRRLELQIMVPVGLLILFTAGTLGVFNILNTDRSLRQRVLPELARRLAGDVGSAVSERIAAAVETGLVLANDPTLHEWIAAGEPEGTLRDLVLTRIDRLATRHGYTTAFLAGDITRTFWVEGHQGLYVISPDDPQDRWYFDTLALPTDYGLNLNYDRGLDATFLFVNVSIPIDGRRMGVTGVGLDISLAVPADAAIEGGDVFLVSGSGSIAAASNAEHAGTQLADTFPSFSTENLHSTEPVLIADAQGQRYFVASKELIDSGFFVVATVPETIINVTIAEIQRATAIIALAAALVSLLIMWFIVRRSVNGLSAVTGQLQELATGEADLTRVIEVGSRNEIGALAAHFNAFLDSLAGLIRRIVADTGALSAEKDRIVVGADTTARSMTVITGHINEVSRTVDRLRDSVDATAEKARQIAGSVATMEEQVNTQVSAIEETSASVEQMRAQPRQSAG